METPWLSKKAPATQLHAKHLDSDSTPSVQKQTIGL